MITILVQECLDDDQDVDEVADQVVDGGDDDEGGGGVWSGRVAGVESINPSLPRYQRHPTAFALYCKL